MKRSVVALAALAASGIAFAQSSVTMFGIVDAGVSHGTGSISDRTQVTSGSYQTSRLGFRGTESLGGGMAAHFWLETGPLVDSGVGGATNTNNQASGAALAGLSGGQGLTFARRATVALSGGWGEVRLGRDYTPQFHNLTTADPFLSVGVGASLVFTNVITGVTAVRASNTIGYLLPPNLGGFYGQVQHYRGENLEGAVTEDDGTGYGIRVGFARGAFDIAIATGRTEYAAGDVRQSNIAGSWDFNVAKLMAGYYRDSNGGVDARGYQVGVLMPVGAGQVRAAFSSYKTDVVGSPKASKLALGYIHHLSKRTAVYTTVARLKNSGGAAFALGGAVTAPNSSSNGFDVGLRHTF